MAHAALDRRGARTFIQSIDRDVSRVRGGESDLAVAMLDRAQGRVYGAPPRRSQSLITTPVALNRRGDTHQVCPLLKVNRPCHQAAVTSQFDPKRK